MIYKNTRIVRKKVSSVNAYEFCLKSLHLRTFWSKKKAYFTIQVYIIKSAYSDDSSSTDVGESKMQAYTNFERRNTLFIGAKHNRI